LRTAAAIVLLDADIIAFVFFVVRLIRFGRQFLFEQRFVLIEL